MSASEDHPPLVRQRPQHTLTWSFPSSTSLSDSGRSQTPSDSALSQALSDLSLSRTISDSELSQTPSDPGLSQTQSDSELSQNLPPTPPQQEERSWHDVLLDNPSHGEFRGPVINRRAATLASSYPGRRSRLVNGVGGIDHVGECMRALSDAFFRLRSHMYDADIDRVFDRYDLEEAYPQDMPAPHDDNDDVDPNLVLIRERFPHRLLDMFQNRQPQDAHPQSAIGQASQDVLIELAVRWHDLIEGMMLADLAQLWERYWDGPTLDDSDDSDSDDSDSDSFPPLDREQLPDPTVTLVSEQLSNLHLPGSFPANNDSSPRLSSLHGAVPSEPPALYPANRWGIPIDPRLLHNPPLIPDVRAHNEPQTEHDYGFHPFPQSTRRPIPIPGGYYDVEPEHPRGPPPTGIAGVGSPQDPDGPTPHGMPFFGEAGEVELGMPMPVRPTHYYNRDAMNLVTRHGRAMQRAMENSSDGRGQGGDRGVDGSDPRQQ